MSPDSVTVPRGTSPPMVKDSVLRLPLWTTALPERWSEPRPATVALALFTENDSVCVAAV